MMISPNFSLNELIKSQTATRLGIDNTPTEEQLRNLKVLVLGFLQPLRDEIGLALRITSCLRVLALDRALNPGRKTISQHSKGEAADFEITGYDNYELAFFIKDNMEFDQLILEYYVDGEPNSGWIHCSFKRKDNRKQVLSAVRNITTGKLEYLPGLIGQMYN